MLPVLVQIEPQLKQLRSALSNNNNINSAIADYECAIASLPAQFGWQVEYEIREALGLDGNSNLRRNKEKGWKSYISRYQGYDPLKLLEQYPKLAVAFLCHNDGYVREEALRQVHHNKISPFLLTIISVRLNDWVPAVRTQAIKTLFGLLDHVSNDYLSLLVPFLIIRSNSWNRWKYEKSRFIAHMVDPHFIVRISEAMIQAKNGSMSRCLGILSEHSEYDASLMTLHKSAAQPTVRERATRMLLDGYASIFRGYHLRRRLVLAHSINELLGITHNAVMENDINRERVKVFEQRPLTIKYSKAAVLTTAAKDKSPFVRRHAASFLITQRQNIYEYRDALDELKEDQHPFVAPRMNFLFRKLEE